MSHIFISYSKKNQPYARRLARYFIEHGFDVWIDDRINFGDNWWNAIDAALESCGAVVVVMTPQSLASRWCQREVFIAEERNKPLFPLLLDGENWSVFVLTQYADVTNGNMPDEAFLHRLAEFSPRRTGNGMDVTQQPTPPENVNKIASVDDITPPPIPRASRPKSARWIASSVVSLAVLIGILLIGWQLMQNPPATATATESENILNVADELTLTPNSEPTNNPTLTLTLTLTRVPTRTFTATLTLTPTGEPSPTATVTLTPTNEPSATSTLTLTPTREPIATSTPTLTATNRPTSTPTRRPTNTPRPTRMPTSQPSNTPENDELIETTPGILATTRAVFGEEYFGVFVVTSSSQSSWLNIRSCPNTSCEVLATVPPYNYYLIVTGRNADNTWFQIEDESRLGFDTPLVIGWISSTAVDVFGDTRNVPVITGE